MPTLKLSAPHLVSTLVLVLSCALTAGLVYQRSGSHDSAERTTALLGLAGSVRSQAALAHSIWVANGRGHERVAVGAEQVVDIDLLTGFPQASDTGIGGMLSNEGELKVSKRGAALVFSFADAPAASCNVTYITGAKTGAPPRVTVRSNNNGGDCS